MSAIAADATARAPDKVRDDRWIAVLVLLAIALFLAIFFVVPLGALLIRSFTDDGDFVGLANFAAYFSTPALFNSLWNSLFVAAVTTIVCVTLAFLFAYALTRTCMPLARVFRAIAQIPILAPSLLPGISLVYLFGNQGMLKELLFGASIYGPIGIVIGEVFYTFPHALMILITALSLTDARLYEAADSLGASRIRTFFTVTLPGAKYGLISAVFVVFTLTITDFGVPKVIGGKFNVLATDIYKQVIGQQNFEMGAVVAIVLLAPAVLAFVVDRLVARKQIAQLSARAVPYAPKRNPAKDWSFFAYCVVVSVAIAGIIGMAGAASFIKLWPYNLALTFDNYRFDLMDGGGWAAYYNSIELGLWVAVVGTFFIFAGAYMVEKIRGLYALRGLVQFAAVLPMAVPGLALGLGYIFFFNYPGNPLGFLYGTMAILVLNTVAHFYTVPHLTAATALKQLDHEFESVSQSLKVPFYVTFARVTLPVCSPALLDIGIYLFLNAMTTASAVVFLYAPDTALASIAVLNMDDAGDIAPAAAMAMMIVYTSAVLRLGHEGISFLILRKAQAWRRR
ncbi:MAG: putative 2-aminoethylphosphonate ABC transporter permease subunit [Reyranellaceae bacterium]